MSELRKHIMDIRRRGEKALGIFVTCGFPSKESTIPILQAVDAGGADFIELGMPFSDPLAEGLPIQRSSARALSNGLTMDFTFETASAFRAGSDTPIVLMGYINPVLQYGVSNFFKACRSCNVAAVILPDLPLDDTLSVREVSKKFGIDVIHLIAPTTTEERMRMIDDHSEGFVYAVSMTGLTGTSMPDESVVNDYLQRVSQQVKRNPLLVGFGIRSGNDVSVLSEFTDGCIVGSAVIGLIDQLWNEPSLSDSERQKQITDFVAGLKAATLVRQN
jgi:tryptophan synthase alpha chain